MASKLPSARSKKQNVLIKKYLVNGFEIAALTFLTFKLHLPRGAINLIIILSVAFWAFVKSLRKRETYDESRLLNTISKAMFFSSSFLVIIPSIALLNGNLAGSGTPTESVMDFLIPSGLCEMTVALVGIGYSTLGRGNLTSHLLRLVGLTIIITFSMGIVILWRLFVSK
jgi:VIT1/CCC1 family predicted Fe2+/Mn2+ transporter